MNPWERLEENEARTAMVAAVGVAVGQMDILRALEWSIALLTPLSIFAYVPMKRNLSRPV